MVPESHHDEKNLIEMGRENRSEMDQETCHVERKPSEKDRETFLEETNLLEVGHEKDLHQEMNREGMALETFRQEMDRGTFHEMLLETSPEETKCHEMALENQYEGMNHVVSQEETRCREMDFANPREMGTWMVPETYEILCIHAKTICIQHMDGRP